MTAAKKLPQAEPKQFNFQLHETVSSLHIENCARQLNNIPEGSTVTFDFLKVNSVEKSCYSSINRLRNLLQKNKSFLKSENLSKALHAQLKTDGVLVLFHEQKPESKPAPKLDVKFITPFITGTLNALKVQANVEAKNKSPYLKDHQNFDVDIAGVLSLVSDAFVGSISLCFPKMTFLKICEGLFGEPQAEITPDIQDAAGELLNMIFGAAKAELNDKNNYEIKRALPTVIVGNSLKLKQSSGPTIVLPFESEAGSFHLEIEIVDKG